MIDIIDSIISKTAALHEIAKQFDNMDFLQKIADLQKELIEMQMTHNRLRKENIDLQEKVQTLEDTVIKRLVFKTTAYFYPDSDEAFCPGCIDGDRVPVRLVPTTGSVPTKIYKCLRCKNTYRLH
jgi:thioesterase domain-containing protein